MYINVTLFVTKIKTNFDGEHAADVVLDAMFASIHSIDKTIAIRTLLPEALIYTLVWGRCSSTKYSPYPFPEHQ